MASMNTETGYSQEAVAEMRREVIHSIGRTESQVNKDRKLSLKVDFFLSSIVPFSKFKDLGEIIAWLTYFRENNKNTVERIGIKDLEKWRVEEQTGNIRHESGKFFSIEGVRTRAKDREVASLAIANYHRGMILRASDSLEKTPGEKRDISSLTVALNKKKFEETKRRIQEFRRELNVLLSEEKEPDSVYQINFQIFNLSEVSWSKK